MSERAQLLQSIATTIADYREGEIPPPTSQHVDKWIRQFDEPIQEPVLRELDHVLKKTYLPRTYFEQFLDSVLQCKALVGDDPCKFWDGANLLNIQLGGQSQKALLQVFTTLLERECGTQATALKPDCTSYVYLDDVIFSGGRVFEDLKKWISSEAPDKATIYVIVALWHRYGQWNTDNRLKEFCRTLGKEIKIEWLRASEVENRRSYAYTSDVLWPTRLPDDELVSQYVAGLTHPLTLRTPGGRGAHDFFSSEEGRDLLEQELLKAGANVRSVCQNLGEFQRPLGNMTLQTLGFGSMVVTYRNCPNNAPLAFWVDAPWYPLFPRKTN